MNRLRTSRTVSLLISLLMLAVLRSTQQAMAGENYAFLVAVGDYDVKQLKPLAYTRNDVLEFAQALSDSGIKSDNIVVMHDDLRTLKSQRYLPQAEKIRKEFDLLLSSVDEGDSVIVAFAGHGVQFEGDQANFFCPIDADLEERRSLISLKEIYAKLEQCPADRKLLLVDACRNDPISQLARSRDKVKLNSVTRPQMEAVPKGIVALFSCSAGQESYEWPDVRHGVFFHHILQGLKGAADDGDQQVSLDELVTYTRKNTQSFARLKLGAIQTPQSKGEFNGTWMLRRVGMTNSIGMTLKFVPSGTFLMGSNKADVQLAVQSDSYFRADEAKSEQPQHRVQITKPVYMAQYETTQAQYEQVMGINPSTFSATGGRRAEVADQATDQFPVDMVSWFDAVEFCIKLSEKEGREPCYRLTNIERARGSINSANVLILKGNGYRLPTEAEWEYACRAETTTPFHFGLKSNGAEANVDGNAPFGPTAKGPYKARTATVGSYSANAFGLYDMHGNVSEWCQDWYDEEYYSRRVELDPQGAANGTSRVQRGGSWFSGNRNLRSAGRGSSAPTSRENDCGFRVVCAFGPKT